MTRNGRQSPRVGAELGRQHGQILVLFTISLFAMIAMVGLVLDGGSAYAQRRGQQNAADLAALAGANDYLLNSDATLATARARAVAAQNGYTNGYVDSSGNVVSVGVTIDTLNGAEVKVDISAPHHNNFASIVGMSSWGVSATATALSGIPDTANGAAPLIFSIDAFENTGVNKGKPLHAYSDPANQVNYGGCQDTPTDATQIAWTNYGIGNVDSSQVKDMMAGTLVIKKTLSFGTYIGQHNQGCHADLYQSNAQAAVDPNLIGTNVVVPVVDHNGAFQGWATFHITSADKNQKTVQGYFVSNFVSQRLTVGCAMGSCPRYLGSMVLKLIN